MLNDEIMKRILFITNRNILTTSGELRLIKNRAEELYNSFDVATDFIAFQKPERINASKREAINAGGTTEVFPFAPSKVLTTWKAYKKLKNDVKKRLDSGEYGMVIFSSFLLVHLIKWIKKDYDVSCVIVLLK